MACHTTLKMVKSRTHASMFLWFTTAEFLCNDSRLSECGKSETYCWNSPNVSRGISGFSSSDFQWLVKCECFFHNATMFVLLYKKNAISFLFRYISTLVFYTFSLCSVEVILGCRYLMFIEWPSGAGSYVKMTSLSLFESLNSTVYVPLMFL